MTSTTLLGAGTGLFHLPHPFPLARGGAIGHGQLGYQILGREGAPVVVVQGGISAGRDATAWWGCQVGPGRPIDTGRVQVLGADWLGGNGVSSGPGTASQPFPAVTAADQARATALLLDHLGVARVTWVGASYGAIVGLDFAARFGRRCERLVAIGAAHRADPLSGAWRALQREIVRLGLRRGCEREALALARALAMTTYRTRAEFGARFAGAAEAERYVRSRGAAWAKDFDAKAFLLLSEAIDLQDLEPERIESPVTLVAIRQDQLVPLDLVRDLARRVAGPCELVEIDSPFGHDAFLKEERAIGDVLRRSLEVLR
jgi:homoserine O-acetyltransferase